MVAQHFRWDFIGLSTDTKPTPATSNKVVNGSTFYCSDNSKLYIWYKTQWYEKTATGGGTTYTAGSGITIADNTISVDTTTIQPLLTAGTGIDITDNTISATGGGGGTKSLTRADYNYPTENPYGVATWTLEEGIYKNTDENYIELCFSTSQTHRIQSGSSFLVLQFGFGEIFVLYGMDNYTNLGYLASRPDGSVGFEYSAMNTTKILNNLETTGSGFALDARQGKALKDLIDSIGVINNEAPTTSTAGVLGQLYTDTTNMHTYQCTAIDETDPDNPSYTWTQRW